MLFIKSQVIKFVDYSRGLAEEFNKIETTLQCD